MGSRRGAIALTWAVLLAGNLSVGGQSQGAGAPRLESVIAEAVQSSAELAALRERIAEAEALVRPVGALPAPMASVAVSNVPVWGVELDRTPMSGVEVGLSQGVPAVAKRRLRRQVQREEIAALRARYEDRRTDLVRAVKQAYIEVQYLDAALAIAEESTRLAEDFLATAEARYATGKGIQQDVFRAQVRLSRMVSMAADLRQHRARAATRLNTLLYRPVDERVPPLPAVRKSAVSPAAEALGARAEDGNARLKEARIRVGQGGMREKLAAVGVRPDLRLGLSYRFRRSVPMDPARGEDFWSASVGVSLPWIYRRDTVDQEVKAAEARRSAAELEAAAIRNAVMGRIEELVVELVREDEQIALLETGLLPQAEGALVSSRAAYATGQVEILTLLDNQMNLYSLELQRLRLIADHERDVSELEYLVGGPLGTDAEVTGVPD